MIDTEGDRRQNKNQITSTRKQTIPNRIKTIPVKESVTDNRNKFNGFYDHCNESK